MRPRLLLPLLALVATLLHAGASRADEPDGGAPASAPEAPPLQVAAPPPAEPPPPAKVATPAPPPPANPAQVATNPRPAWTSFLVVGVDGGVALVPGSTLGGFARLGVTVLQVRDPERASLAWGLQEGFEGWSVSKASGFALPIAFFVGVKSPRVVASVGGGFNLFTVDRRDDTTGGGIFSPRANARFGVHAGSLYLVAGADLQRRWDWKIDDLTLFTAGLTLGWVADVQKGR